MLTRRCFALSGLVLLLSIAGAAPLPAQARPVTPPSKSAVPTRSVTAAPAAGAEPLDLNTATPDQLKTLPGIGDAFARRIVDGRPYTMKNQLTQRGILPQPTYDKIKDSVVAKRSASANTAAAPKK